MSDWVLAYEGFVPEQQGLREALCTTGNGYFCTRGALPWAVSDGDVHYPATYLAGGYNRAKTKIADRWIENEDLVALPDWTRVRIALDGGDWIDPTAAEILECRQAMDIGAGTGQASMRLRLADGREVTLEGRQFASMDNPHLGVLRLSVTPHGWSGPVTIKAVLEGAVRNWGVKRYRALESRHLEVRSTGQRQLQDINGAPVGPEVACLVTETTQSALRIGQALRLTHTRGGSLRDAGGETGKTGADRYLIIDAADGEPVVAEVVAALFCSRDAAISEPGLAAQEAACTAPDGEILAQRHTAAWHRLWDRMDIVLEVTDEAARDAAIPDNLGIQQVLRLHLLHLLQSLSPHTAARDIGVPARGWHGEAYRGHIFWDELLILPVLEYGLPAIAEGTLRYRDRRLPKAREAAAAAGYAGAMFPWQSGSDGREESQLLHLNPQSGRWIPDNTWVQRHVALAVAFNVWRHWRLTGDTRFLCETAAPILLDVARFFASLAVHDPVADRFEIHQVMGPDEFHDAFPERPDEPGLRNNAYTNVLVAWLMGTAGSTLDTMPEAERQDLVSHTELTAEERERWRHMARRMLVPFHDDRIISQFAGYETLKEFDWQEYRAKYGDIHRLDRILETEGDHANHYKVSKQADVLMLFYLFSRPQLSEILDRLGYGAVDPAMWQRNVDYYLDRCSHGSTLSFVVHSWVMARSQPDRAWDYFLKALMSDVTDIQGGTTKEGIHLAAMAGSADLIKRCALGLDNRDGVLVMDPCFLDKISALSLSLRWAGQWVSVAIREKQLVLTLDHTATTPVAVEVRGTARTLAPGRPEAFALD